MEDTSQFGIALFLSLQASLKAAVSKTTALLTSFFQIFS